jgi:hypothetical protein
MGPWKFVIADRTGFAERLIGPIRRECVYNIIVLGEAHLRRVAHYNYCNTHRSLGKMRQSRAQPRIGSMRSSAD